MNETLCETCTRCLLLVVETDGTAEELGAQPYRSLGPSPVTHGRYFWR